ncbi:hypothetical protein ACQKII_09515 [Lysinibacillus sp. NPDC048646]|uniref:hypothetical protein n=1 Tax=Lysinibacillus sp. NPDC048646 TaxID=3390574 RepID=UPI003CFEFE91
MIIQNGGWTYDTVAIDVVVTKDEREWYERDMLNAFTRYAYYRYKQIRDCVNSRKCKHMTIDKVREQLAIESKLIFTSELLRITSDEIHYIVDFADKHLQYVK